MYRWVLTLNKVLVLYMYVPLFEVSSLPSHNIQHIVNYVNVGVSKNIILLTVTRGFRITHGSFINEKVVSMLLKTNKMHVIFH